MQINTENFPLLGLNERTALDPCRSISAAATMLRSFARYNTGSPTKGIENGYALGVAAAVSEVRGQSVFADNTSRKKPESMVIEDAPDFGELNFPSKGP
jgi:type IV secretion system protein VirB1